MLSTWDLWRSLARDFDRDLFNPTAYAPNTDVVETEAGYRIEMDLPGINPKDVSITVDHGVLTISGSRKALHEDKAYTRAERLQGTFSRSFQMPSSVDPDGIQARSQDGVLTVEVPRVSAAKPRKIQIQVQA